MISSSALPALVAGVVVVGAMQVASWWQRRSRRLSQEPREYDMERVGVYADLTLADDERLPARAWHDLDLDAVFRSLDHTAGWPGLHVLYSRLQREDLAPAELQEFDAAVSHLEGPDTARVKLRDALRPLDASYVGRLPDLLYSRRTPGARWLRFAPLGTVAMVVLLAGGFALPILWVAAIVVAMGNMIMRAAMKDEIDLAVPPLRALPALIAATRRVGALELPPLAASLQQLRCDAATVRGLGRVVGWISLDKNSLDPLANALTELVDVLFSLEVTAYARSIEGLRRHAIVLRRMYHTLGELDVLQSTAEVRVRATRFVRPVFEADGVRSISATRVSHPVLAPPVPNDLRLERGSMLLTGSNMSGKSTFLRTIGVSAVLARTLFTVFADEWRAPMLLVRSAIGRSDSLEDGVSYYRAEVNAVGELLGTDQHAPRLILIDELFRGTNSVERIGGASAVLEALDHGHDVVVIATHDMELLELLPHYEPFHFRESVRDGALTFDYTLYRGASSTRNALAILALAGYPASVVARAEELSAAIEARFAATPVHNPGPAAAVPLLHD